MSVEFKQSVPDVFVGEYCDEATGQFYCLVVMQSIDNWSAYIDGELVGSRFGDAIAAQEYAVKTLEARLEQGQFKRRVYSFPYLRSVWRKEVVAAAVVHHVYHKGPGIVIQ